MDQRLDQDLFPQVMAANNLELEKTDDQLIIRKGKNKNSSLQGRITLSVIGLIAGVLILIFVWFRLGIFIILGAGSFLMAFMNLREREKDAEKKSIKISNDSIDIKEGYKTKRINLADISEFKTDVQKVKNLFVGKITILTEDKWPYEFLEIFGTDEDLVQEDLLVISNHIVENYL